MTTIELREARPDDAEELVPLIALLGHIVTAEGVAERVSSLTETGCPQLVAVSNDRIVGLCGLHLMTAIHRDRPVGRISILVTAEDLRRRGIGRMLVEAAERTLANAGCGMVEVTSNERLQEAHLFYAHLGYSRTSKRFAKELC